jgi:hypothetical protein
VGRLEHENPTVTFPFIAVLFTVTNVSAPLFSRNPDARRFIR